MRGLSLLVAAVPVLAFAGELDLDLSGPEFVRVYTQGQTVGDTTVDCGRSQGDFCFAVPNNENWYTLASELAVVLAPRFLMPAETVGWSGFSIGFQSGFTKISHDQPHWKAIHQYRDDGKLPPEFLATIGTMAHKGFWLAVLPAQVGAGFNYLPRSGMMMMLVDIKLAIHEGFQDFPLPAIAVRGTGGRMVGNPQMDLSMAGVDFSASKAFGVMGTFSLTPYAGYQLMWIVADPEVIDATPNVDAVGASQTGDGPVAHCDRNVADCNAYFVFFDPDPIIRHRAFVGIRLIVGSFNLSAEFAMAVKGASTQEYPTDELQGNGRVVRTGNVAVAEDKSGLQPAANVMLGLDF